MPTSSAPTSDLSRATSRRSAAAFSRSCSRTRTRRARPHERLRRVSRSRARRRERHQGRATPTSEPSPKPRMIDPAFADAAFALKTGGMRDRSRAALASRCSTSARSSPARAQSLEKVSADIKRELALERAGREVQAMRDKIEDERLDGKTLAQAAEKLSLKLRTIDAVDRSGRGPDGKQDRRPARRRRRACLRVPMPTSAPRMNRLSIQGGGFVWYDVLGITPSRDRPLDEIKAQVETRWRDDEVAAGSKPRPPRCSTSSKLGTPLAEIANANKLKVQTATGLKRGNAMAGFPLRALSEIFRVRQGRRRHRRRRKRDRPHRVPRHRHCRAAVRSGFRGCKAASSKCCSARCPTICSPNTWRACKRYRHNHQSKRAQPGHRRRPFELNSHADRAVGRRLRQTLCAR